MFQKTKSVNALLKNKIRDLQQEFFAGRRGRIEYVDAYKFMEDLYINPSKYFKGTAESNVTHCRQCPNANWSLCGM